MPRDSSGNYSKPPGTTAIPNTTIESAPYNALQDDMADALTESLPRDGSAPMYGNLEMGGQRILGLGEPQNATDAATFGSVDEAVAKFGLGVDVGPLLSDFHDTSIPAGFYRWDSDSANAPGSGGGGAIKLNRSSGRALWIASRSAGVSGQNSPQVFFKNTSNFVDDWGPWEEVYHTGNLPPDLVTEGRTLTAGDGLTGGGDLSANRSFAVDGTVVRTSRNLTAGDGLTGGGNLGSNRSFAVDSSVVRTSGNQTISGTKNFTGSLQTSGQAVVPANRSISAGDGLSGGGNLGGNRSFAVDSSVARYGTNSGQVRTNSQNDSRFALASRTISAGDGLSGGGTLAGNRSFAVDSSVVRTSGSQSLSGTKTFTGIVNVSSGDNGALRVSRPGSNINATAVFSTNDGSVMIGQGDSGWFSVGNSNDLRWGSNGVFQVAKNSGNVRWKGVATGDGSGITNINLVASNVEVVGSYALLYTTSSVGNGGTTSGSSLTRVYLGDTGTPQQGGGSPSGTWRNMGRATGGLGGAVGLFMRIS